MPQPTPCKLPLLTTEMREEFLALRLEGCDEMDSYETVLRAQAQRVIREFEIPGVPSPVVFTGRGPRVLTANIYLSIREGEPVVYHAGYAQRSDGSFYWPGFRRATRRAWAETKRRAEASAKRLAGQQASVVIADDLGEGVSRETMA